MPTLLNPIRLGAIEAPNRIFMAPLTRGRSTREHVPTPLMAEYYAQRASAGLIITEATGISREASAGPMRRASGPPSRRGGWRPVTEAVHKAGGRIVAQLWHMGRIVHPSFLGSARPVSASASTAPGEARTYDGKLPYVEARPLGLDEIPRLLDDYRAATLNAMAAGFDGVEIHAANGYLIDQFLRDGTNHRQDAYGGPVENRIRLLSEVAAAVAETVGAERTGVRLSPNGAAQGCSDSHPEPLFTAAAAALSALGIAFLELREPLGASTFRDRDRPPIAPLIRKAFARTLILNSDFTPDFAEATVAEGKADAITFGRPFIANPDLPSRIAEKLPLATAVVATFYSRGPEGYVDYPLADVAVPAA
jgi:N-ethylmaleimide reductase